MTNETSPNKVMRTVAITSRLVLGALLGGGLVAGAILVPNLALPEVRHEPVQSSFTPEATDSVLVCSGPFRALGRNAADASEMQAAAEQRVITGSLGADALAEEIEVLDLAEPATAQYFPISADNPSDASGYFVLAEPDLRGLAAGACRPPSMQAWIVGGAASVGTSDVLTLSNPGDVASRVTLTTFGGEEESTQSLLVPPHTQLGVALATGAAGASTPVVRVDAEGAPVHASLQSSLTRILDPSGVDLQDSAGLPETELVFAGVHVAASGEEELMRLRLFAPEASTDARVSVRALGRSEDAVAPQTVELRAGEPIEIPFAGLPAGTYSVQVSAESPVIGAVWQSTGTHSGSDFAWMTPAPELNDTILATIPGGAGAQIHLVNRGDSDARVVVRNLIGPVQDIVVPARSSAVAQTTAGRTYEIQMDAAVHAAVVLAGQDRLAGWPLWPAAQQQPAITIYP